MDPDNVKREVYEQGYSNYTGESFDGDDEDLYDEVDEYESDYSCEDY